MKMKTPDKAVTLFDEAAATWDKPIRVELARGVARAIINPLPLNRTMTAMEFGCGTGLVTALLAPHLGKVVATDSSSGMLAALRKKIDTIGLANILTRQLDLTRDPLPEERYQLIYSSMTLHHIADIGALMRTLHALLAPGGRIALADLASEDGTFHSDSTGVMHLGLAKEELLSLARQAGFTELSVTAAHVITKEGNDGKEHDYPVIMLTGKQ